MDNTYINILADTLNKKIFLLDKLLDITVLQEEYLNNPNFNIENFDQTLEEKEEHIKQINQLDEGFEKIYTYIQEELNTSR